MPALASIFLWPAGRPRLVLGLAILLSLGAAAQLVDWHDGRLRLEVDPSVRALLPRGGEEIERYESSAWLAAGVGTAALLGGALWFTLDVPLTEERYQPPLRVQLGPNGVKLEASFD